MACNVLFSLLHCESSDPECAGYPWFRFYAHVPTCGPLMRDTRKATSPMIEIARVSTADDKSSSA